MTASWCPLIDLPEAPRQFKGLNAFELILKSQIFFGLDSGPQLYKFEGSYTLTEALENITGTPFTFNTAEDRFEPGVMAISLDTVCYSFLGCTHKLLFFRMDIPGENSAEKQPIYKTIKFRDQKNPKLETRKLFKIDGIQISFIPRGTYYEFKIGKVLIAIGSILTYTTLVRYFMDFVLWSLKGGYEFENLKYVSREQDRKRLIMRIKGFAVKHIDNYISKAKRKH